MSRKKSKKHGRKPKDQNKDITKGKGSLPIEEISPFGGGKTRGNSNYNLRKGAA
jgi:hypothetical protein